MKAFTRNFKAIIFGQMLLLLASPALHAAEDVIATDPTKKADKIEDVSLLSKERLIQLDQANRDYETRSTYGLLDQNDRGIFVQSQSDQRGGILNEILSRQLDNKLKNANKNLQENTGDSAITKSVAVIAFATMIYHGKTFTHKLSSDTELSASAKAADRSGSVKLTSKNICLWNIDGGINYAQDSMNPPSLTASVSKELAPHVSASVDQKRWLAGGTESTGQLRFGANF